MAGQKSGIGCIGGLGSIYCNQERLGEGADGVTTLNQKKHPCPDCKHCQQCSSVRCHLCRGQGADAAERRFAGLSLAGQIELFEAVNRGDQPEGRYPAERTGCRAELFTTVSPPRDQSP